MITFTAPVVGVTFEGRQAAVRRCVEGQAVELRHQVDNPHDPRAVAVYAASGEQLGFLPRAVSARLVGEYGEGLVLSATISEVLHSLESWGLRIEVRPPANSALGEWAID